MAIYTKQFWYLELEQHIQLRAGLSEVQRPTKHIHLRASGCSKERPSLSKNYSQWQNKPSHQKTSIITGTWGQHEAHCCVFSPTLLYPTAPNTNTINNLNTGLFLSSSLTWCWSQSMQTFHISLCHPGQLSLAIPPWAGTTNTSKSWEYIGTQCNASISAVSQGSDVYGRRLQKQISVPLWEELLTAIFHGCSQGSSMETE